MTAPTAELVTATQRRDLRQLAGAGPYALWLRLYVDESTSADEELAALIDRNKGDLRLAAADLLDGLVDGEETVKKLKLEGELEVEFLPAQYASKSASLRAQVSDVAVELRRFGPPLAGMAVSRVATSQVFGIGGRPLAPERERS